MTQSLENLSRLVQMRGTKAAITAFTAGVEEAVVAFATDTSQFGIYTGGAWTWLDLLSAQSGNVVLASPADGSSGIPAYRSLVAADLTSVATGARIAMQSGSVAPPIPLWNSAGTDYVYLSVGTP